MRLLAYTRLAHPDVTHRVEHVLTLRQEHRNLVEVFGWVHRRSEVIHRLEPEGHHVRSLCKNTDARVHTNRQHGALFRLAFISAPGTKQNLGIEVRASRARLQIASTGTLPHPRNM